VADPIQGDAFVTRERARAVGVLTADCVPVLVLARDGVAAIHAGWKGIVAGVVSAALARLDEPVAAWVGPAIRACCYEVGPDVTSAFEAQALPVTDPWHVEPAAAVCAQLRRAGLDRIAASNICTSCDPRFFSYRRDRVTGRQGGFIALL
jgi:YfiH family protein